MRKQLLFVFLFLATGIVSRAQLNQAYISPDSAQKLLPNKVISQLATSIKPASFVTSFAQGQLKKFQNLGGQVAKLPEVVSNISALIGGIKPELFKTGFDVKSLLSTASTIKTMASAGNVLKQLEGGLKPEAFLSTWPLQRSTWLSNIGKLK